MNSLCKGNQTNPLPPHASPYQLANDFGDFFYKKIERIKKSIDRIEVSQSQPILERGSSPEVKLDSCVPMSVNDVHHLIMTSSSASCKLDPIPTWLLKRCSSEISPVITSAGNNFFLFRGHMSFQIFLLVGYLTNWTGHNLLTDNTLKKRTRDVLVTCSVIVSDYNNEIGRTFSKFGRTMSDDRLLFPALVITKMINLSFQDCHFPGSWKIAHVNPLLKRSGLDAEFADFRPVSNLSFVSKTTEKAAVNQLFAHCESFALLPTNQSAYRKFHSTETALLRVQSDILMSIDRQEVTLLILLDLSSAFDTIDHKILLDIRDNDFGIIGNAKEWIKSFLCKRQQHVLVEDEISKPKQLDCGVPQGSCLGPVLFLLYASGLFQVVNKHLPTAHAYADDSQIYLPFRPHSSASQDLAVSAIESCVADVRAWLVSHRLMFNDTKTELLIIGSKRQLSKVSIDSIKVGDSQIKPSETVRNLG